MSQKKLLHLCQQFLGHTEVKKVIPDFHCSCQPIWNSRYNLSVSRFPLGVTMFLFIKTRNISCFKLLHWKVFEHRLEEFYMQ